MARWQNHVGICPLAQCPVRDKKKLMKENSEFSSRDLKQKAVHCKWHFDKIAYILMMHNNLMVS